MTEILSKFLCARVRLAVCAIIYKIVDETC